MKTLLFMIAVAGLAVIAFALLKRRASSDSANAAWPFYVKKPLTQPEQILYHRLVKALPDHIVLAQVQVSRVLGVKKGFKFNEWNNRINRLSYDFVVCGRDSTVVAAIELDDKSHETTGRAGTDNKKDKATADAGVRMIRWQVKSLPDDEAIRTALSGASMPGAQPVTGSAIRTGPSI
ncbi:MAG: Zn-finger domain associated with topoisomerase type [Nitrospira sp.]|jgi:hypothetical protein|nr:Zn-finger domain associated with topoisomerase type [Nitrospira sp.]